MSKFRHSFILSFNALNSFKALFEGLGREEVGRDGSTTLLQSVQVRIGNGTRALDPHVRGPWVCMEVKLLAFETSESTSLCS